jgi:hypothetical protein
MIFITETILNYANRELNKDGTINLTHGEMVTGLINTNHRITLRKKLKVYFDTSCTQFASVFEKF